MLHLKHSWNLHLTVYPLKISLCLTWENPENWAQGTCFCLHYMLQLSFSSFLTASANGHRALLKEKKKKTWKMLHSLWHPPQPRRLPFSLCVFLSFSSQPPLPVLTFIKPARPPGGGVAGLAAPPPAHLLSSCLQATHFCGLKSTHRWASIQSSLWAATLYVTQGS